MDFNYSAEDEAFRQDLRKWLEANKQYAPGSVSVMSNESDEQWQARVTWHKKLNDGGWVAVNWPKEYGGRAESRECGAASAPRYPNTAVSGRAG